MLVTAICPACQQDTAKPTATVFHLGLSRHDPAHAFLPGPDPSPEMQQAEAGDRGLPHLKVGLAWLVGGLVVTAVSFAVAEDGGTYVLAWGAVLFGGLQALRGLLRYLQHAG
jgi:hypothetical protein